MAGFSHDIAGGNGDLVVTSVQSPNYDPDNNTGWRIAKDGTATFYAVDLPGFKSGTKVTLSSTPPAAPNAGDLWYDTANGLQVSQYNGTAWVPYQIGTGAIADSAITNDLLSSSVTARSLGGITTTISATQPASGVAGDLWIDTAAGNSIHQYDGANWNLVQLGGTAIAAGGVNNAAIAAGAVTGGPGGSIDAATIDASNIVAGTITGDLIAASTIAGGNMVAGTITGTEITAGVGLSAPVISGGTIEGSIIVATNTSGEFLGYTAAPASGNLYLSISPTSGSDGHGNTFTDGVVVHGPSGTYAQLALNQNNNLPYLVFQPPNFNGYTWPQVYAQTNNQAAVNQQYQLSLESGREPSRGGSAIFLVSDTSDGTANAYIDLGTTDSTGTFTTAATVTKTAISAYVPVESATPSWYNMLMSSGWTIASGGYFQCKLMPDNTIAVRGSGLVPGTLANGTDIAALPYASFNPVTDRLPLTVWVNYTTPPSSIPTTFPAELQVRTTGAIWCYGLNTGTVANISVYGRYPLD